MNNIRFRQALELLSLTLMITGLTTIAAVITENEHLERALIEGVITGLVLGTLVVLYHLKASRSSPPVKRV